MTFERKWLPEFLFDECSPPPKDRPEDWMIAETAEGATLGDADEPDGWTETVIIGGTAWFVWLEIRGSVDVHINPDGSYEALGPIPEANNYWCERNEETVQPTIQEFCACFADGALPCDFARPITVEAYHWSEPVALRLIWNSEGLRFVPLDS